MALPRIEQLAGGSKMTLSGNRVEIGAAEAEALLRAIFEAKGCYPDIARDVTAHLIETELTGIESHGVMRVMQYAEQFDSGYMTAKARARLADRAGGLREIDGGGGIGIPALALAVETVCRDARSSGIAVIPVRNVGHTGRLGAYAEAGAEQGCFVMIVGGGGRQNWRQVAPYGGRKAMLPTNPYAFGMPGGEHGPVVVDFATSIIAGGLLYAARAAGAMVPAGALIDRDGQPTRDPAAYFDGGAILPKGGPMGYGLALIAEMLCEAMLGPVTAEVNWLVLALDTARYRAPHIMQNVAEEILSELRACPPADGFDRVEIPGERERARRASNPERILRLPEATWRSIEELAATLGVAAHRPL